MGSRELFGMEKLKDQFARLDGDPPYDGPGNIERNDAYSMRAMEREWGMPIAELRKIALTNDEAALGRRA